MLRRAAIYARFSSDRQRDRSIDDQVALCQGLADRSGWTFPHLFDESQDVARAYQAACTPEFYLFDAARRLVHHGRFDASRPQQSIPVTGDELRRAADALLAGEAPPPGIAAIGCGIKWRDR